MSGHVASPCSVSKFKSGLAASPRSVLLQDNVHVCTSTVAPERPPPIPHSPKCSDPGPLVAPGGTKKKMPARHANPKLTLVFFRFLKNHLKSFEIFFDSYHRSWRARASPKHSVHVSNRTLVWQHCTRRFAALINTKALNTNCMPGLSGPSGASGASGGRWLMGWARPRWKGASSQGGR